MLQYEDSNDKGLGDLEDIALLEEEGRAEDASDNDDPTI